MFIRQFCGWAVLNYAELWMCSVDDMYEKMNFYHMYEICKHVYMVDELNMYELYDS